MESSVAESGVAEPIGVADQLHSVTWTYFEQAALERALRDELSRKAFVGTTASSAPQNAASQLGDLALWRRVAEAVNSGAKTAAEMHAFAAARRIGPPKSAAECLKRYLALREITRRWHQRNLGDWHAGAASGASSGGEGAASAEASSVQSGGALVAPSLARATASAATPVEAPAASGASAHSGTGASTAAARRQAVLAATDRELRAEEAAEDERAANRAAARKAALAAGAAAAAGGAGARSARARRAIPEEGEGSASDEDAASVHRDGDDAEDGESVDDDEHPHEHEHDHDDGHDDEDEDEDPASLGAATSFAGIDLTPAHKGYRVALPGLSLFGVGTLAAARIEVAAQCSRCSTMVTATLQGARAGPGAGAGTATSGAAAAEVSAAAGTAAGAGAVGGPAAAAGGGAGAGGAASAGAAGSPTGGAGGWQAWCPKCSLLLSLSLRPTLLHEGDPTVGYVDCPSGHAIPTTINAMRLLCTCLECGALAEVPRLNPPTHRTWESSCRACFTRLRVDARAVDVAAASVAPAPAHGAWKHGRTGAGTRGAQRLIPGRPLPDGGTCKHYGQSYRWLRFPCCGVAFPCDTCHDAASDHPHEWARRMICGHCAREQPFSSTAPCVACGRFMTRRSGPIGAFLLFLLLVSVCAPSSRLGIS